MYLYEQYVDYITINVMHILKKLLISLCRNDTRHRYRYPTLDSNRQKMLHFLEVKIKFNVFAIKIKMSHCL